MQEEIDKLLSYKIETTLDRNLLLGIWSSLRYSQYCQQQQDQQEPHAKSEVEEINSTKRVLGSGSPRLIKYVNYEMSSTP